MEKEINLQKKRYYVLLNGLYNFCFFISILLFSFSCESRTENEVAYNYYRNKNYEKALNKYEKLETKNRISPIELVYVGLIYLNLNKKGLSVVYFKKAIDIDPKNHFAYMSLGYLNQTEGKYNEALENYFKSIEYQKEIDCYSYLNIARVYDKLFDYENAIKYYLLFIDESKKRIENKELVEVDFQDIEFAKSYVKEKIDEMDKTK